MPDVAPLGDVGGNPSIDALQNALKEHSHNFIKPDIEDPFLMEVRRGFVLSDALELIRVSQDDLHNPLKISFSGEDGVDLGGLRREFWSLFLHNISNSVYVKGMFTLYDKTRD
ncbi:probable E3 ubiquitin-protein ligase HERC3 [Mytilus californianus]|uniref:probable E3 ubiquitin-protein ligase HERC3 n=1 Tax=Mytilus californianus TaxID=6549 RepID=UPI002247A00C|nr:probable E3 ubiquitin-protein ligase HERC3 [Mytilus californianus]